MKIRKLCDGVYKTGREECCQSRLVKPQRRDFIAQKIKISGRNVKQELFD